MAAPRRKYTNEMKLNAVHLVQNEGRRACDVADELGIDRNTLYGCAMLATANSPLMIPPARSRPSRLKSLACALNSPAPVRSARC